MRERIAGIFSLSFFHHVIYSIIIGTREVCQVFPYIKRQGKVSLLEEERKEPPDYREGKVEPSLK